jgi:hypothetical protein
VLQKKPGVSNFVTSAYISSKKMIGVFFNFWWYENSKELAIIQYFAAHWAIKNKQMTNVWTLDLESESSQLEWRIFSYNSDIESNWVTLADVSSKKMIDIHFLFYGFESSKSWFNNFLTFL